MFLRKWPFLLLSAFVLPGCTAMSTYVATIGERTQYGVIDSEAEQSGKVKIHVASMYFPGGGFFSDGSSPPLNFPYIDQPIVNTDDVYDLGEFPYTLTPNGMVTVVIEDPLAFKVGNMVNDPKLSGRQIYRVYRLPYSYPAQLLQVVAVPVDIASTAFAAVAFAVVMPVVYVYSKVDQPH